MEREFAQSLKTFKDLSTELRIKFFLLWNVGLHSGNTKRLGVRAVLDAI